MNKLYIVRHGVTDWNKQNKLQGSTNIALNCEGIEQARKLAEQINLDDIDICFCSPLKRAKQTAEIIVKNKMLVQYDELLLERKFGDYEGKNISFAIIKQHWNYKLNDSSHNIESLQECLQRANEFLKKIKVNYPNKSILIVSHGSFIKALHFNIIGYSEKTNFLSFKPQNAKVYTYILD